MDGLEAHGKQVWGSEVSTSDPFFPFKEDGDIILKLQIHGSNILARNDHYYFTILDSSSDIKCTDFSSDILRIFHRFLSHNFNVIAIYFFEYENPRFCYTFNFDFFLLNFFCAQ